MNDQKINSQISDSLVNSPVQTANTTQSVTDASATAAQDNCDEYDSYNPW